MSKIITLEEMNEIAASRGGKCLSKKIVNSKTKLEWQCSKGHVWESTPFSIKNMKSWCPDCSGHRKLTIDQMQKIAAKRNGRCLSKKYDNGSTKLKWECAEGHIWEATPSSIKYSRSWCPQCRLYQSEEI